MHQASYTKMINVARNNQIASLFTQVGDGIAMNIIILCHNKSALLTYLWLRRRHRIRTSAPVAPCLH